VHKCRPDFHLSCVIIICLSATFYSFIMIINKYYYYILDRLSVQVQLRRSQYQTYPEGLLSVPSINFMSTSELFIIQ
jgi:hypothetical protein